MAKAELEILIQARDMASGALTSVQNKTRGLTGALEKHSRQLKIAGAAMIGVAAGITAGTVKLAADFDAAMREVNSLILLSSEEFAGLSKDVLAASAEVGKAPTEMAQGLYQVVSAGVAAADAVDFLKVAAEASIAGITDTTTAVDGLTTVLNAFHMQTSQAKDVADIMFEAVKRGKTTFPELASAMSVAAPIAANVGVSFEELAAAVTTVTKSGSPTAVAMTQVRAALVALISPNAKMNELLSLMGVASGAAALEAFGLQGSLIKLREAAQNNSGTLAEAFGRVEGFNLMLGLTGDNAAVATADLAAMQGATEGLGSATEALNIINEGANRQFEQLTTQLRVAGIQMGTALLPTVLSLVEGLTPLVSKLADWTAAHPGLTSGIITLTGALGGLMIGLSLLPSAIAGVTIVLAALASPITLIVGLIAALGVAVGLLIRETTTAGTEASIFNRPVVDAIANAMMVPGFQHGGIVTRPTLGLIGEAGPEAVVPLGRGRGAAMPGGTTVNLSVGYMLGDREDAERLLDIIQRGLRTRQRLALGEGLF